jgi:phosphate acetyltransferase
VTWPNLLGAKVLNAGDYETRRMSKIILCARTVLNTLQLLKPGVLVVTPGDRDDIILAVSLAAMNGVPLAGLLLTSDTQPDPRLMELCRGALQAGSARAVGEHRFVRHRQPPQQSEQGNPD